MAEERILVVNGGSSSLKFGIYAEQQGEEQPQIDGEAQEIRRPRGTLQLKDRDGRTFQSVERQFVSEADAFNQAADLLADRLAEVPAAIGHRIVHGGPRLSRIKRLRQRC